MRRVLETIRFDVTAPSGRRGYVYKDVVELSCGHVVRVRHEPSRTGAFCSACPKVAAGPTKKPTGLSRQEAMRRRWERERLLDAVFGESRRSPIELQAVPLD